MTEKVYIVMTVRTRKEKDKRKENKGKEGRKK